MRIVKILLSTNNFLLSLRTLNSIFRTYSKTVLQPPLVLYLLLNILYLRISISAKKVIIGLQNVIGQLQIL